MADNMMKSRMQALEETVNALSRKVETLSRSNVALHEKTKQGEKSVLTLIGCCRAMVQHIEGRKTICSPHAESVELSSVPHKARAITIREEKSLNTVSVPTMTLYGEVPELPALSELVELEIEMATGVQWAPEWESAGQEVAYNEHNSRHGSLVPTVPAKPSEPVEWDDFLTQTMGYGWDASQPHGYGHSPKLEETNHWGPSEGCAGEQHLGALPVCRKRKAIATDAYSPGPPAPSNHTSCTEITFINMFATDGPKMRPAKNLGRRARKTAAQQQLMTPPPEAHMMTAGTG